MLVGAFVGMYEMVGVAVMVGDKLMLGAAVGVVVDTAAPGTERRLLLLLVLDTTSPTAVAVAKTSTKTMAP